MWLVADADLLWEKSTAGCLVAAGWCWFGVRIKYCWLDAANRVANQDFLLPKSSLIFLLSQTRWSFRSFKITELERSPQLENETRFPLFFIWWNRRVEIPLHKRTQETKKENKGDYKRLSIHSCMPSEIKLFALCIERTNSFLNMVWHAWTDGCKILKMKSLRVIPRCK